MNKAELLKLVDPKWHAEFLKFVDSGEASEEFLKYADTDIGCQKAIEIVMKEQAEAIENLARVLRFSI